MVSTCRMLILEEPSKSTHHVDLGNVLSGESPQGHYRGCRATRDGGYWELYRNQDGSAVCALEVFELTTPESTVENAMLKEELRLSLQKAAAGTLRFGAKADVREIHREPDMLELRLGFKPFGPDDGIRYKFRLYFAEPAMATRLLLGLKFAKAPASKAGLEVQDTHIDEAGIRYITWTQARIK